MTDSSYIGDKILQNLIEKANTTRRNQEQRLEAKINNEMIKDGKLNL